MRIKFPIALGMLICFMMVFPKTYCNSQEKEADKPYKTFKLSTPANGSSNYKYTYLFFNNSNIYTYRDYTCATGKNITFLMYNPSGSSFAYIETGSKQSSVTLCMVNDDQVVSLPMKFKETKPLSLCYSADSRVIFISEDNGRVSYFSSTKFEPQGHFDETFPAKRMVTSSNGYFMATSDDHIVTIRETESFSVRKSLSYEKQVVSVAFSPNSRELAVLTSDGTCSIYDTRMYKLKQTISVDGNAKIVTFHPDEKHIAIAYGENLVSIVNMKNVSEKKNITIPGSGFLDIDIIPSISEELFLSYSTRLSLGMNKLSDLTPNRTRSLTEELNFRMDNWMKQMPGESLNDYEARVNEENRMHQMQLFELEIATAMAGDALSNSAVSLGNYNMDSGLLEIDFSNMAPIFIPVAQDQLETFSDPASLTFSNTQYCINAKDEFELVYADVTNTATGQTFTFDNRERKELAFLMEEASVITLDQIKMSKMEEMKLEEMTNAILSTAKDDAILSDHTSISVKTKLNSSTDASGNSILNYDVDIAYAVEAEYSNKDDFPSGRYKIEESNAAIAMSKVIEKALSSDFSKYVVAGKKVVIGIKGSADASPVKNTIPYDGCYGEYEFEPVKINGELSNITVTKATGITTNPQLAFLRALGIKYFMEKNIPALREMKVQYNPEVEVSKNSGSEFRRISVHLSFIDIN